MNFLVGTSMLLVACLVHEAIVGLPERMPTNPLLYLGGLIGAIFIGGAAVVVRVTGGLPVGLGSVAGQLATTLVINLPGNPNAVRQCLDVLLPMLPHAIKTSTDDGGTSGDSR